MSLTKFEKELEKLHIKHGKHYNQSSTFYDWECDTINRCVGD